MKKFKIENICQFALTILILTLVLGCSQTLMEGIREDISAISIESIEVTAPINGEVYSSSDSITFRWTSRLGKEPVKISVNDGVDSYVVISSVENGLTNTYTWESHGLPVGDYTIRIALISNENVYDESENTFAVRDLAISSPNSGDLLSTGGNLPIVWSSGLSTGTVKIELKRSGILAAVIATNVPVTNESYDYTIPSGLTASTDYWVTVTYEDNPTISQDSAVFGIITSILLTAPAISSEYLKDDACNITWDSSLYTGSVKIDLFKNGLLDTEITSSTENDGSYTWTTTTASSSGGDDYTIEISTITNPALSDESGTFTINRWESWDYATSVAASELRLFGTILAYKDGTDNKLKAYAYSTSVGSWSPYKQGTISDGDVGPVSRFIFDSAISRILIAYSDMTNSGKADAELAYTVSWTSLPGFASDNSVSHLDFCYGGSNSVYYMGYRDDVTGSPLYLAKFNSTAWSQLGEIISNGVEISMDMDPLNFKPFIMYRDLSGSDRRFRVKRYNSGSGTGITFDDFGIPDQSSTTNLWRDRSYKLIVDPSRNPVVMFYEYNYDLVVRRWNGSSWDTLYSEPGFLLKNAKMALLSDGTPILTYFDNRDSMNNHVEVLRYNSGTTWDSLGDLNHTSIGGLEISGLGNEIIIALGDYYSSPQYKVKVYRYK